MKLTAQLLALVLMALLASSCATMNRFADNASEPTNWRDYNDC